MRKWLIEVVPVVTATFNGTHHLSHSKPTDTEQSIITNLIVGFSNEADEHEEQNRPQVVEETGPVIDAESSHEGTHQHEENGTRTQNGAAHQHTLQSTRHYYFFFLFNLFKLIH